MTVARGQQLAPLVFATVVLIAIAVFAIARHWSHGQGTAPAAAHAQATKFLDDYVDPDGRVVRRDQGGDTVSEGQAYGMLAAIGTGDARRFRTIWQWTQKHLQRSDGLFSWHWQSGNAIDTQPASDADVDIARALSLAAARFHNRAYTAVAARTAGAVLSEETLPLGGGRTILAAGPWARSQHMVDPSYFSPTAGTLLASVSGDSRFQAINTSQRAALQQLTAGGSKLPPDWASVSGGGRLQPAAAPSTGGAPQYGLDAVRLPVRMAESCNRADRALAARWWTLLRKGDPAVQPRQLDGQPAPGASPNPAAAVGAAAAAAAAGQRGAAERLLRRAKQLEQSGPTYYGSAWVALGELMLTSDTLGGCPPL